MRFIGTEYVRFIHKVDRGNWNKQSPGLRNRKVVLQTYQHRILQTLIDFHHYVGRASDFSKII